MHDRTNTLRETLPGNSKLRQHDHSQWVNKYLDLADTALKQEKTESGRTA